MEQHPGAFEENPIESDLSADIPRGGTEVIEDYGARTKLRIAREAKGLSIAELAKKIGYSVSVYQGIEESGSRMGEKMAKKAAKILDIPVEELLVGSDEPPSRDVPYGTFGAESDIRMGPGMEGSKAKFVPLLSMAQCGTLGAWDDGGYAGEGYLAFDVRDPKAFAVTLAGGQYGTGLHPWGRGRGLSLPSAAQRHDRHCPAGGWPEWRCDVQGLPGRWAKGGVEQLQSCLSPMSFTPDNFSWIYPVAQVSKRMPGF